MPSGNTDNMPSCAKHCPHPDEKLSSPHPYKPSDTVLSIRRHDHYPEEQSETVSDNEPTEDLDSPIIPNNLYHDTGKMTMEIGEDQSLNDPEQYQTRMGRLREFLNEDDRLPETLQKSVEKFVYQKLKGKYVEIDIKREPSKEKGVLGKESKDLEVVKANFTILATYKD